MKEQLAFLKDPAIWLSAGALGAIAWIARMGRSPKTPKRPSEASDYGSHGTGRWATSQELEASFATEGAGAILGRMPAGRGGWRPVIFPWDSKTRNRFVLLIGPPGSGKTSRYTLTNLLHAAQVDRGRSIICTDPKGELYRNTAALYAAQGFNVRVINLDNQEASDRYNPMDYVHSVEDALRLANTIIANTGGTHAGGDQFWVSSERTLLAALIWYAKCYLPKEAQHLGNVLHLGNTFAKNKELMDTIFAELPDEHGARQLYNVIAALSDKTRDGVFVGFAVRLQLWASPQVVSLTAASDFNIRELGEKPTILYLIIPDHDATFRVISSMFFDQVFQQLIALADSNGGRLNTECRLMLEEMANIGRIPDLEKRLATIRSRGLLVEMVLQTIGQLRSIYGDADTTIIGCSDTLLVLAANDQETAETFSRRLGTMTIRTASTSTSQAQHGGSQGTSYQYTSRPLMLPDEVQGQGHGGLKSDELLLVQRGLPPARVYKFPYEELPTAANLVQKNPADYKPPARGPVKLVDPAKLQLGNQEEEKPDWAQP